MTFTTSTFDTYGNISEATQVAALFSDQPEDKISGNEIMFGKAADMFLLTIGAELEFGGHHRS